MVQTFDAVQCAACESFQVQTRGASKKRWACVMCGEKQSYVRIFASGAAKELRPIVQRLNYARGEAREQAAATAVAPCDPYAEMSDDRWYGDQHEAGAWPQAADPYSWAPEPQHHPPADSAGDIYVTEMPSRAPKPKRKYADAAFRQGPVQHEYGERPPTWMDAQEATQHDGTAYPPSRAPPRSFHRVMPPPESARMGGMYEESDMYVTAGTSEVFEEEVWQG